MTDTEYLGSLVEAGIDEKTAAWLTVKHSFVDYVRKYHPELLSIDDKQDGGE